MVLLIISELCSGKWWKKCFFGTWKNLTAKDGLNVGLASLAAWSGLVGRERLWIAPGLALKDPFPGAVLEFADTVLLDTYHKDQVGGTGETGDWNGFAALKQQHPMTNWLLAGGLNPQNVLDAIAATGAERVDLNSGVESEPGIKNPKSCVNSSGF